MVQASKETSNASFPKKLNASKNTQVSAYELSFIYHKFSYFVPDDKIKRYVKEILNKPVEVEYFLNKSDESEIRVSLLKPLEQHNQH